MKNKIKVVCPKCQAKLNLAVEKMESEVLKFRCPGCSTVLKVKKPTAANQEKTSIQYTSQKNTDQHTASERPQQPLSGFQEEKISPESMRRYKRVKFKQKVLVDNQIMVEALDISENGLFLHTGRSFEDGSTIQVGIPTLPGSFDLVIQATVQHNHRGIGMGLQFRNLDDTQKKKLQKLIKSLDESARKEFLGKKVILLAGGSDTARNINKSKLVLDGFYVLQATNADEVFRILQNETPDAMVLDWQETSFYSKGLLAQIRQTPQYDNVIIIVLAALTDASAQKEILDAGAERYMAKMDTNPAKLSKTLSELIEERDG